MNYFKKENKIIVSRLELLDKIHNSQLQFLGLKYLRSNFPPYDQNSKKQCIVKKMSDQVGKYIRILDLEYWCNNHWRFFFQFLYSLYRYCVILSDMCIVYVSFVKSHNIHIFDIQMSYPRLPFKFLTFLCNCLSKLMPFHIIWNKFEKKIWHTVILSDRTLKNGPSPVWPSSIARNSWEP